MSNLTTGGQPENTTVHYLRAFKKAGYSVDLFRGMLIVGIEKGNVLVDFQYITLFPQK
jgi:hypothetical protein